MSEDPTKPEPANNAEFIRGISKEEAPANYLSGAYAQGPAAYNDRVLGGGYKTQEARMAQMETAIRAALAIIELYENSIYSKDRELLKRVLEVGLER